MADRDRIAGEDEIIQKYLAPLAAGFPGALGLEDDCALLTPPPGQDLVLTTDAIAEKVHFLPGDAPEDIAWKALAVNVSDLAAKGAQPIAYLMSLAFPSPPLRSWMRDFARGLGEAQEAFGCHLAGGDTDRRPGPITITITAIGSVPSGRMVRRGGARPGDRLVVSGTIGDAAFGLRLRRRKSSADQLSLTRAERKALERRYLRPEPRIALAPALVAHASAAMDISDGLVKDAERLCRASRTGAIIRAEAVPLSRAASKIAAAARGLAAALTGGDDYEILAAIPPPRLASFKAAAATSGVPVAEIGEIVTSPGLEVVGATGKPLAIGRPGYEHF